MLVFDDVMPVDKVIIMSFNPCFSGCWSSTSTGLPCGAPHLCFNPCFSGCWSSTMLWKYQQHKLICCFNPCFSGCWSSTIAIIILLLVLILVSILVLVDVGLRPRPARTHHLRR